MVLLLLSLLGQQFWSRGCPLSGCSTVSLFCISILLRKTYLSVIYHTVIFAAVWRRFCQDHLNLVFFGNRVEQKIMRQVLLSSSIPGNRVTRRTTFTLFNNFLNGFYGCEVVVHLYCMSVHRPFAKIYLSVHVALEYTVVLSTVSEVVKGVQNVIVESPDCVVMLHDFYVVTRKFSMLKIQKLKHNLRHLKHLKQESPWIRFVIKFSSNPNFQLLPIEPIRTLIVLEFLINQPLFGSQQLITGFNNWHITIRSSLRHRRN